MITYKCEIGSMREFHAWGQAKKILNEIEAAGKMDALDNYISELCDVAVDGGKMETEGGLNDLLAYDWERVYEAIGMPIEESKRINENTKVTITVGQLKKLVRESRCKMNETVEEYGEFPPAETAGELANQIRRILNHYFENDPFDDRENEAYDETMEPEVVLDLVVELMKNSKSNDDVQELFNELQSILDKYFEEDPFTDTPNDEFDETMSATDAVDQIVDVLQYYVDDIDDGENLVTERHVSGRGARRERKLKDKKRPRPCKF